MNIQVSTEKITPELALKWLAKSDNVRGLNEYRAREFAAQMENGGWELNGESIKFDTRGNLVDGQHRLKGCVIAKKPFTTLVVKGIPSANNVDTGYKRSLYQILHHEGFTDSHRVAPAINLIQAYQKFGTFRPSGRQAKLSVNDAVKFARENEGLQDIYSNLTGSRNVFGRDSIHIALYYLFAKATNKETADKFYLPLISGVNLKATSPVYHLRERLIREHSMVHRQLDTQVYASLIIKAWNLWRANKKVASLKYDYAKENVPKISK